MACSSGSGSPPLLLKRSRPRMLWPSLAGFPAGRSRRWAGLFFRFLPPFCCAVLPSEALALARGAAAERRRGHAQVRDRASRLWLRSIESSRHRARSDFPADRDTRKISRLDAAKKTFIEFVEGRPDDLVGLVVFANFSVTLFGVDFKRGATGVLYDSLGLNGATVTVLGRVLNPDLWKQELAHAGPTMIAVNYGSNESSFGKFVHTQYANELRLAIQRTRQAAPGVPILIMSPMDRGERSGLDDIETMSTIPEIVAIQQQVAAEMHCAFFDTYDAMGASGTMARWYVASPRLVTADLLHPTPQGATIVAGLFVAQLDLRYDRWKMQHGIALPPPPVTTSPNAEKKVGLHPRKASHHIVRKGKQP